MRSNPPDWRSHLHGAVLKAFVGILVILCTGACPFDLAARPAQTGSSIATGSVYSPESFASEMRRLRTDLETARNSPEALRRFRESLPKSWIVEGGARRLEVPSSLLISRLTKAEKTPEMRRQQLDQSRGYLDALAQESDALSRRAQTIPDSAPSKLNAILSRPEFSRVRRQTWWDRLRARVNEFLLNTLGRILRSVGGQRSVGLWLFWVAVCAAAIFIAYSIVRRWLRAARMEEMTLQNSIVPARSWQEWVFAGREAAMRGDYRVAIHCAYWAAIARLQDLGSLSPSRSKTPREYLRMLAKSDLVVAESHETRRQALSSLTSRLERTWYGYQPATEADFRDSLAQLETLGCHLR